MKQIARLLQNHDAASSDLDPPSSHEGISKNQTTKLDLSMDVIASRMIENFLTEFSFGCLRISLLLFLVKTLMTE